MASGATRPREPRYLRPQDVRQLRAMQFSPRVMVEGALSGKHRSTLRGASMEFHEYRGYAPGDPPALVDWRVFARSDRLHLKTFRLETHLECHLLVDSSASMGFSDGPWSKRDWACFFAAGLAYLVTLRQDRVSLTLFDEGPRNFLPPGSTPGHLRQMMAALEEGSASGGTDLAGALEKTLPLLKRRGTVVVLSDFLVDPGELFRSIGAYTHRGFRVFLFQVLTPTELNLPAGLNRRFVDPESGRRLSAQTDTIREAYAGEIEAHQRSLAALAVRRGIDFVAARTDQSWIGHLRHLTR